MVFVSGHRSHPRFARRLVQACCEACQMMLRVSWVGLSSRRKAGLTLKQLHLLGGTCGRKAYAWQQRWVVRKESVTNNCDSRVFCRDQRLCNNA